MREPDDAVLKEITNALVSRFRADRVALFGSRARGDQREDSDYDIFVVIPDDAARRPTARDVRDVIPRGTNVDVVANKAGDYEWRRSDVGTMAYVVEREGRILYDRNPSRWPRRVREQPASVPRSLAEW